MGETPDVGGLEESSGSSDGGSDGSLSDGLGGLGLTRRQLVLIGALVAVVIALYLYRQSSGGGSSDSISELEKLSEENVEVTEEEGQDGVQVTVPADPDDELEKDAAAIEALRQGGHISSGDDE